MRESRVLKSAFNAESLGDSQMMKGSWTNANVRYD